MVRLDGERELPDMDSVNLLLNLQQYPSTPQIQTEVLAPLEFDPASTHDDFLEKMLSSVPASAFPWGEDQQPLAALGNSGDHLPTVVVHQEIKHLEASSRILQQQLAQPRGLTAGNGPTSSADQNDVTERAVAQPQTQNSGSPTATAIGSCRRNTMTQSRQRVRARRGQATDPHSIAERLRRERIAERMKALQELLPNANKADKALMLEEIIDYVKFLQLQVKVLSMSRLGCCPPANGVSSSVAANGKSQRGDDREATAAHEAEVAKLMEEDMGAAMQYLQGKGLCLMPISLNLNFASETST